MIIQVVEHSTDYSKEFMDKKYFCNNFLKEKKYFFCEKMQQIYVFNCSTFK